MINAVPRSVDPHAYTDARLHDLKHEPVELVSFTNCARHAKVREVMHGRLIKRLTRIGEPEPQINLINPKPSKQRAGREHELMERTPP